MWNLNTNELIYETEMDSDMENKLMVTKERVVGGIEREVWDE